MISHNYWYDIWSQSVKYSQYTEDDVLYTGLPFFHGNAQGITIGPAILADAKAVIVDRFSASSLWDDCRKWECTEANYIGGIIPILMKAAEGASDGDSLAAIAVLNHARAGHDNLKRNQHEQVDDDVTAIVPDTSHPHASAQRRRAASDLPDFWG